MLPNQQQYQMLMLPNQPLPDAIKSAALPDAIRSAALPDAIKSTTARCYQINHCQMLSNQPLPDAIRSAALPDAIKSTTARCYRINHCQMLSNQPLPDAIRSAALEQVSTSHPLYRTGEHYLINKPSPLQNWGTLPYQGRLSCCCNTTPPGMHIADPGGYMLDRNPPLLRHLLQSKRTTTLRAVPARNTASY